MIKLSESGIGRVAPVSGRIFIKLDLYLQVLTNKIVDHRWAISRLLTNKMNIEKSDLCLKGQSDMIRHLGKLKTKKTV